MSLRIIQGVPMERKPADWYNVKAVDLGNGHFEAVVSRGWTMEERDMSPLAISMYREHMEELMQDPKYLAERAEINAERAGKRAKQRVRHLCKAMGADTLLTLTYKSNQTDLALCKVHLKEFIRRLKRVIPNFRAVAAFEQQKRGAWHVHIACERLASAIHNGAGHKVKSFDLVRSVWRSVTKDHGGNIDVQSRKRNSQRSAARIASYLSKYITKSFEDGVKHSNRYSKFGDFDAPKAVKLGHMLDLRESIELVYSLVDDSREIVSTYLSRFKDVFFFVAGPPC